MYLDQVMVKGFGLKVYLFYTYIYIYIWGEGSKRMCFRGIVVVVVVVFCLSSPLSICLSCTSMVFVGADENCISIRLVDGVL